MNDHAYELAGPGVVSEKFQEGLVILNLETGQYFDAGGRTVLLLDMLVSGTSLNSIREAVKAIDPAALPQLDEAIQKLTSYNLLREIKPTKPSPSMTEARKMLETGKEFYLECHDDLAELIAADPVHDVDPETGRVK